MATHAVLEELGVAYELIEIDLTKRMQRSPDYPAINPHGKVPTSAQHGHLIHE